MKFATLFETVQRGDTIPKENINKSLLHFRIGILQSRNAINQFLKLVHVKFRLLYFDLKGIVD